MNKRGVRDSLRMNIGSSKFSKVGLPVRVIISSSNYFGMLGRIVRSTTDMFLVKLQEIDQPLGFHFNEIEYVK
jgi:RNase P/RNase MRP subunit p29